MNKYSAKKRYYLLLFLGLFLVASLLVSVIIELLAGSYLLALITFLISFSISYVLVFLFPKEITFDHEKLMYRTFFVDREYKFSQIERIEPYYSTRSLSMAGGDKKKAHMICMIKIRNKRLSLMPFGRSIYNYKKLYSQLNNTIKKVSDMN